MTCRLFGVKLLHEPMMTYFQLELQEYISIRFELKYKEDVDDLAVTSTYYIMFCCQAIVCNIP